MVLNLKGDGLIAIQGDPSDPASKRVTLPLSEAVSTTILDSTGKVDAMRQEQQHRMLMPPSNDVQQPAIAASSRAQ